MIRKKELIETIAQKAGFGEKEVEAVIKAFTETVGDALKDGNSVQLLGFGTFDIVEHPARTGRNPSTGETIQIAASKSPRFKPGSALKEKVRH